MNDFDIVTRLRMYAEDLHSAGGFNGYASAMSLAADEIERLRQAVLAEREACAQLCEEHKALRLSEIIRARGEISLIVRGKTYK